MAWFDGTNLQSGHHVADDRARPPVTVVVLAAGTANRFGSTKQLAEIDGVPLVRHVVDTALAADVGPVVVVLGHAAGEVASVIPPGASTRINPRHVDGQSSSVACGLAAAEANGSTAALILLADEPGVTVEAVRLVAMSDADAPIVRARYDDGVTGHPVLIRAEIWVRLDVLGGDAGARALHDVEVAFVDVAGKRPFDIDRPSDLADRDREHL